VRVKRLASALGLLGGLWLSGCASRSTSGPARPTTRHAVSGVAPTRTQNDEPEEDPAANSDDATESEEPDQVEALDDSAETAEPAPGEATSERPHPLDGWSESQIAEAVARDLRSLGSMSLGSPNAGALLNGVQARASRFYEPVSPSGAWGTQETLDFLDAALRKVHEQFPDTRPLALGDISNKAGGPSHPHLSHQSGRDVDIGYFYNNGAGWYARGTAQNLDLARNWAFVRALITETDVDLILIDHSIQALLEEYARKHGEDPNWLSGVFRGSAGNLRPIIRHAPGHATHIHIRFFNPVAQETARRCHVHLLAAKLIRPAQSYASHVVKKNETLGMIARKYRVSIPQLRAANGLKSSLIRAKSKLRIPVAARGAAGPGPRLRLPPRRLPPPSSDASGVQPPPTK
jgi:murein endopeptidase